MSVTGLVGNWTEIELDSLVWLRAHGIRFEEIAKNKKRNGLDVKITYFKMARNELKCERPANQSIATHAWTDREIKLLICMRKAKTPLQRACFMLCRPAWQLQHMVKLLKHGLI